MTIHQKLKAAGCEISNHESDLYVKATKESREILKDYEHRGTVTNFTNQIDKQQWFEVPFAFDPFWEKAERSLLGKNK